MEIKHPKVGDVVEIEWLDIVSDAAPSPPLSRNLTWGRVSHEDQEMLSVLHHVEFSKDAASEATSLPWGCIKRVTILHPR